MAFHCVGTVSKKHGERCLLAQTSLTQNNHSSLRLLGLQLSFSFKEQAIVCHHTKVSSHWCVPTEWNLQTKLSWTNNYPNPYLTPTLTLTLNLRTRWSVLRVRIGSGTRRSGPVGDILGLSRIRGATVRRWLRESRPSCTTSGCTRDIDFVKFCHRMYLDASPDPPGIMCDFVFEEWFQSKNERTLSWSREIVLNVFE